MIIDEVSLVESYNPQDSPKLVKRHATEARYRPSRWASLDQLAALWGLSRARTSLVVQALVRSGRMEVRAREEPPPNREFRLVPR